jgi:hypothetical protein
MAHSSISQMPFRASTINQFTTGTRLRHYKGGQYVVVGTCLIEATLTTGVLYKPLQGDKQDVTWMRPLSEFQDFVATGDGSVPRFVLESEGAYASVKSN